MSNQNQILDRTPQLPYIKYIKFGRIPNFIPKYFKNVKSKLSHLELVLN